MSAIASAYKITEAQLSRALALLDGKQHEELWKVLGSCQIATLPYSGYVLTAVLPFARQRGIDLPLTRTVASLADVHRKQLGIVACGNAAAYENAVNGIAQLRVTDAELRRYYNDLYAHDWDEAATAMREGFAFVQRGVRALNSDDELLILSIL